MRAMVIGCFLVGAMTRAVAQVPAPPTGQAASDASSGPTCRLYFWRGAGAPLRADAARAGFVEGTGRLGPGPIEIGVDPGPSRGAPAAGLVRSLDAARSAYQRFAYAEAVLALDELEREVDTQGGGPLDSRQLSDLFFYRWLSRGELGKSDGAWDDLVQAARLAPSRVLDAAEVSPRAVSAWRRALAEVARLPRSLLEVEAPADSIMRVDGAVAEHRADLVVGRHYVHIEASGFEAWAGVVNLATAGLRLAPSLRPQPAPELESLPAPTEGCVVLGAIERSQAGWRFIVRMLELPLGRLRSEAVMLADDTPVRAVVAALARRVTGSGPVNLLASPAAPRIAPAPATATRAARERRWHYIALGVGGGLTIAAALAISLGVAYGRPAAGGTISLSASGL